MVVWESGVIGSGVWCDLGSCSCLEGVWCDMLC